MADGSLCTVVARPNVFDAASTAFAQVQAGQTLAQMLGDSASLACDVTIGGHIVPRAIWANVRPKAGQTIHVTVWPQGGGNGSKWLRAIAMVVVAYLSYGASTGWGVAAFGSYAGIAGAAIGIIGMMAVNALIPPPTAKAGAASDPFSSLQSLTGTSNQANPYGVIPCVVGQAQYFPPHAAQPRSLWFHAHGKLRPEMYARVSLLTDEGKQAVRLPNGALVTEGLYSFIFIETAPRVFVKRKVQLSVQDREYSYVTSGVAKGERVVIGGALLLQSEMASGT